MGSAGHIDVKADIGALALTILALALDDHFSCE